jgi:mono/diheme cytochrome c family protein
MKRALLVFAFLPLVQSGASAQTTGSPEAGKAYWDRVAPRNTDCMLCHGGTGEGGFGPDLAGRGLSAAQVLRAVRKPWGVMPAFDSNQVSDQDAADLAAYFASLPKPAEPGQWRFEVPARRSARAGNHDQHGLRPVSHPGVSKGPATIWAGTT